jgi:hypothetical protein
MEAYEKACNYIQFTQGICEMLVQQGYFYFIKKDLNLKDEEQPDLQYFELSFYRTADEAKLAAKLFERHGYAFWGHMIDDEAVGMTRHIDACKFLVKNIPY